MLYYGRSQSGKKCDLQLSYFFGQLPYLYKLVFAGLKWSNLSLNALKCLQLQIATFPL